MSEQTIVAMVALGVQAAILFAVLFVGRRERFQFSLQAALLWLMPLTAIFAWVVSWDGPFISNRRVITHKAGLLVIVLGASGFVAMSHRGWLRPRALIVVLALWSLLFCWLAWRRHQDLPREQTQSSRLEQPVQARAAL